MVSSYNLSKYLWSPLPPMDPSDSIDDCIFILVKEGKFLDYILLTPYHAFKIYWCSSTFFLSVYLCISYHTVGLCLILKINSSHFITRIDPLSEMHFTVVEFGWFKAISVRPSIAPFVTTLSFSSTFEPFEGGVFLKLLFC